ncbi:hypothetical protein AAFF_G00406140 [Aldrovandia affinis]|uniref:PH domain-containing protein n=1 Tax=Aldrovandia affinis TaxID=143900 RepID=A0AAD7WKY4_9TELE|nr:hypothetical protein AAFF_G00406140 [Aldrovandia affinis]
MFGCVLLPFCQARCARPSNFLGGTKGPSPQESSCLELVFMALPSTLPQGTINMNQCSDVIDGEARTGQKNSLCILTPDKEHFIRAENKEIINGAGSPQQERGSAGPRAHTHLFVSTLETGALQPHVCLMRRGRSQSRTLYGSLGLIRLLSLKWSHLCVAAGRRPPFLSPYTCNTLRDQPSSGREPRSGAAIGCSPQGEGGGRAGTSSLRGAEGFPVGKTNRQVPSRRKRFIAVHSEGRLCAEDDGLVSRTVRAGPSGRRRVDPSLRLEGRLCRLAILSLVSGPPSRAAASRQTCSRAKDTSWGHTVGALMSFMSGRASEQERATSALYSFGGINLPTVASGWRSLTVLRWQETLVVYPRTNKQNQKKKRKVEPPTPQFPNHIISPLTEMHGMVLLPYWLGQHFFSVRHGKSILIRSVMASRTELMDRSGATSPQAKPCCEEEQRNTSLFHLLPATVTERRGHGVLIKQSVITHRRNAFGQSGAGAILNKRHKRRPASLPPSLLPPSLPAPLQGVEWGRVGGGGHMVWRMGRVRETTPLLPTSSIACHPRVRHTLSLFGATEGTGSTQQHSSGSMNGHLVMQASSSMNGPFVRASVRCSSRLSPPRRHAGGPSRDTADPPIRLWHAHAVRSSEESDREPRTWGRDRDARLDIHRSRFVRREPGPAKVAVTSSSSVGSIASAERVPASRSSLWQEERRGRGSIPCSRSASCLSQLSQSYQPPYSSTEVFWALMGKLSQPPAPRLKVWLSIKHGALSVCGALELSSCWLKPCDGEGSRSGLLLPLQDAHLSSCAANSLLQSYKAPVNGGRKARVESGYFSLEKAKPEPQPPQQLSLSSPSSHGGPHRYSSSDTDPLTSPYYPSPERSGDPFPPPGPLYSNGGSTISSSQSSLDSEASSTTTPTSAASWDGRGGGGAERAGRAGRGTRDYTCLADVPRAKRLSHREAFRSEKKRIELRARTRSPGREEVARPGGGGPPLPHSRSADKDTSASVPQPRLIHSTHSTDKPTYTTHLTGLIVSSKPSPLHTGALNPYSSQTVSGSFPCKTSALRSQVIEKFESLEGDGVEHMETSSSSEPPSSSIVSTAAQRQGRSERRHFPQKQEISVDSAQERSMPDVSSSSVSNYRRTKSLDRRATESSMTSSRPMKRNRNKVGPGVAGLQRVVKCTVRRSCRFCRCAGWMTKLYEEGLWKKHWFVLTDQSLRYYRDSIAEEAADLDGEIDLSTCYDVTEIPVQRNYGFQIHTKEGAFTLSAMTSGIRRNWIQAIMKNVRPTIAPDVTRSLPEERAKARARWRSATSRPQSSAMPRGACPQGDTQTGDSSSSEQRKSRIRERRREGRSKTFDWAEFRQGQPPEKEESDGQPEKAAEKVDVSSASSSTAASSPRPPRPCPPPRRRPRPRPRPSGTPPAAAEEELEQERARRREERRRRFQSTAARAGRPGARQGPPRTRTRTRGGWRWTALSPARGKPPDVRVEIEQRWHQVETTPLREEKQVPITTVPSSDPASERLPPQELATILDKELEQTQKELAKLQEQNSLLQSQLQDARGREHSAREGYVLQSDSPSSSPPSGAWQRLHKLNQDLQNELAAQRRKQDLTNQQVQALKRNYSEAKDVIRHHESEIQALQAKLNNAMAEILISEQAVAKMRSELKLEQERFQDRKEDWEQDEQALRTQLKDSEDRLKDVEAHLLEKSQALRDLERQQALQRDHLKEVQKLQERLAEVTGRLIATEEAQALKEERLQKNLHVLRESQEKERQSLVKRLAEAEGKVQELEDRLQDADQQVEGLLRERHTSGLASSEVVHQLEEQLAVKADAIEKLTEVILQLQEEKSQLTCRCQELLNQIAEEDNEVTKLQSRLKTEETDYYNLEHSYEKVSEEFQKITMVLREKEEEIREAKEMYERLMERKEQDLNEAMIKMAALGSSLEETGGYMEPCGMERDLQAKLVVAEDRINELEQHLNELQLGYSDLQMEHCKLQEDCDVLQSISRPDGSSLTASHTMADVRPKASTGADVGGSLAKRPRIRFSSIHCQKYVPLEGTEKLWTNSTSSDISQDHSLSEESGSSDTPFQYITSASSDPEKFILIIHTLETKLCTTEEKLKEITLKLDEQQGRQLESMAEQHSHWAKSEAELREQLNESLSKVDQLTTQLQLEMDKRCHFAQETDCSIRAVNAKYEKALACVESSREKVQAILRSHKEDSTEMQLCILSEIETELVNATMFIRQGGSTWEEQQHEIQNQEMEENKVLDEERIKLFAKTLAFEALVLNKMAFSIQNPNLDLLQGLSEIHQEAEKLKRSDESYTAIVYADVLSRKLMLESEFWAEVEKLEEQYKVAEGDGQGDIESVRGNIGGEMGITIISNACIKAELAFAVQNLKHFYEEKLQKLRADLQEAHKNLQHRELALKEIVKSSKRSDFDRVVQEVSDEFGFSERKSLAGISPPELAPYVEQIEMEEARDLAEEVISRHLQGDVPSCSIEFVESTHVGRERLAAELRVQAEILQHLSQDIEQSMDILCQEHARNIGAIRERYEASMQDERQSFTQAVSSLQEENEALKGEVSIHVAELSRQQEQLVQLEEHFRGEMEQLKDRYELELSQAEQRRSTTELALMEKTEDSQRKLEAILMDIERMEDRQEEHVQKLEDRFQGKIQELQRIHEEEMQRLHTHYMQTIHSMQDTLERMKARHSDDSPLSMEATPPTDQVLPMEEEPAESSKAELDSMMVLRERIQELETQMNSMKDELENKHLEGDVSSLKEKYQKDFESLKVSVFVFGGQPNTDPDQGSPPGLVWYSRVSNHARDRQLTLVKDQPIRATCERGFAAMEETHHKVIEDIQRQHQREVSKLLEERERLLAEETAATIAAIEAMKNAHREELEKNQRSQLSGMSSDIDELRQQYEEELQSIHRELEVLSEQYSQKCLENAHLAQALEAERQALRQCQRENQELNSHNQELNNRLTVEISRMRSCFSGEMAGSPLTQGKDLYELEVLLRVKESEIQYLKQEIHSLKDELQSALRDKKYTTDRYKNIYTELSIVKAKADCDIGKLKEQLMVATEALGERSTDGTTTVQGYDIMKSKSNPDFLKKERSSLSRQIRGVRSKVQYITEHVRHRMFRPRTPASPHPPPLYQGQSSTGVRSLKEESALAGSAIGAAIGCPPQGGGGKPTHSLLLTGVVLGCQNYSRQHDNCYSETGSDKGEQTASFKMDHAEPMEVYGTLSCQEIPSRRLRQRSRVRLKSLPSVPIVEVDSFSGGPKHLAKEEGEEDPERGVYGPQKFGDHSKEPLDGLPNGRRSRPVVGMRCDRIDHFPILSVKGRCRMCPGGHTSIMREKCNVRLRIVICQNARNCFHSFHCQ